MNKVIGFAFLAFALSGLLMTTSMSESFAAKGGNGSENANTQSCQNEKGQAPTKNPNCDGGSTGCIDDIDCDGDGISDVDENLACTEFDNPDTDGDGVWDNVDAAPCDPNNQ
jgi:hypothetical protein